LQVYYELDEQRTKEDAKDVAICRVEQLCPFPYDLVQRELKRYPSKWCFENGCTFNFCDVEALVSVTVISYFTL